VIKLTFKGLKVLQNKIERSKIRLESVLYNTVENEANYIQLMSSLNAPYRSGELRRSQYKNLEERNNNKRVYKIGFKKTYAVYQEFGTGKKFRLNKEYSEFADLALPFKKGTPIISVSPQRYFLHYFVLSRRRLNRETSKNIKRIFK
jgi:hypothetical protein